MQDEFQKKDEAARIAADLAEKTVRTAVNLAIEKTKMDISIEYIKDKLNIISNDLKTFTTKNETEVVKKDIQQIKEAMLKHFEADTISFGSLKNLIAYGMGGLAVITFIAPFIIKYLFKI